MQELNIRNQKKKQSKRNFQLIRLFYKFYLTIEVKILQKIKLAIALHFLYLVV